jgi:NADH-quinone oxidoreductase subunit J
MNGLQITPNLVLFAIVALIAAVAAIGVVFGKDPVRSALALVLNFVMLAFLYFTLNARFLGIVQVVVYTGAIMVLFLFVIMLLNLGAANLLKEKFDLKQPVAIVFGLALFASIGSQVLPALMDRTQVPNLPGYGGPEAVGRTLFTEYAAPFECVSVLLLVGIVGSILLAKRKI